MQIDQESFKEKFTMNKIPKWNCSSCQEGKLFFKEEDITAFETIEEKKKKNKSKKKIYLFEKYFLGTITCNNPECKEIFTIAGKLKLEKNSNSKFEKSCIENYYPQYIFPTLHIFNIPEETAYDVQEAIITAFKVFWINNSACANAIRTTVELILNDKNIKIIEKTNKKWRKLSLHERIELFKNINSEIANKLMALKWIGNAGSHDEELENENLLDAFEILQIALEKLYNTYEKEINKKTNLINKRKKPL